MNTPDQHSHSHLPVNFTHSLLLTPYSCRHAPDIGLCLALRVLVLDYLLRNRNAEYKKTLNRHHSQKYYLILNRTLMKTSAGENLQSV